MDKFKKFKPFIYMAFGILFYTLINHVGAITQFLGKIFGTVAIFVYGMVISVFLNPVLDYLEKHSKLNRIKSIILIYASLLIIVSLLLFLGVPTFLNNIRNLTKEIPDYVVKLNETFSRLANLLLPNLISSKSGILVLTQSIKAIFLDIPPSVTLTFFSIIL